MNDKSGDRVRQGRMGTLCKQSRKTLAGVSPDILKLEYGCQKPCLSFLSFSLSYADSRHTDQTLKAQFQDLRRSQNVSTL